MRVALTDAQVMLSQTARDWLSNRWPLDGMQTRLAERETPRELWNEVCDLGWTSLGVSEAEGGSGGSLGDLVVLSEELGYGLFPTALGSTIAFARLSERAGHSKRPWNDALRGVVEQRHAGTLACQEPWARFGDRPGSVLQQSAGALELSGEKWFVRDALASQYIAVHAVDGRTGDVVWVLVRPTQSGVLVESQENAARDGTCRLTLNHVEVEDSHVLPVPTADGLAAGMLDLMLLESARLAGHAARALDMAIGHATTRVQFGRPIGSFQAIQHKVADMTLDVESSRLCVHYAAYLRERGAGVAETLQAKFWTSEAAGRVLREAHQIHGGIGYITEHPLHLFFRSVATGSLLLGAPNELLHHIADAVLGAPYKSQENVVV